MRIIDLEGTALERGQQQGELMASDLERLFADLLSSNEWRDHKPSVFPDPLLRPSLSAAGRMATWPAVRRHLPFQAQRMRGLANGLGIRRGLGWGIQFLEVVFCEAGSSMAPPPPVGCTVIQATPRATAQGQMLMGRNYDFPRMLQPYQVIRRDVPSEPGRLATTTLTQGPMVGTHFGVNEAGVAASANNARLWRGDHLRRRGVPFSMLIQEILERATSTQAAIEIATSFPSRSNAGFIALADASGDAAVVEYTASSTAVRRPNDAGVLAQANHFSSMPHANVPEGTRWTVKGMEHLHYLDGSRARQQAATQGLQQAAGSISVATMQAILSDHAGTDGNDGTVCAHGRLGGTLAGMVAEPGAGTLWVALGNPCSASWTEVPFRGCAGKSPVNPAKPAPRTRPSPQPAAR